MSRLVTKDELEHFAKIASHAYLTDKTPMNSTITKIAEENGYLNKEHLKRIIEMSNSNVYQDLYGKEEDKNIHFDVADPREILKEDVQPVKVAYDTSVYMRAPKEKHIELQKQADYSQEDIMEDYTSLYSSSPQNDTKRMISQLNDAKDELEFERFSHERKVANLYNNILKLAEKYIDNDVSVNAVLDAVTSHDLESSNTLLQDLGDRNKVDLSTLVYKKEGHFINPDNELVKLAFQIAGERRHVRIYEEAIKEANFQLELLKEAI